MRQRRTIILLGVVWLVACRLSPTRVSPPIGELGMDPPLSVDAAPGAATELEIRRVRELADTAYARYTRLLGRDRMPSRPISILLAGDADDGQVSTVSPESGVVVLYRHRGAGGGYTSSIAHEMMHALRWDIWKQASRRTEPFLFVEEGFAELMAIEVGLPSTGFPTYGHDISVAAGTWIASDLDLPIRALVTQHSQLNFRCMPQAYTLRLSFVLYLRERIGLDALVRLAFASQPLDLVSLEAATGAPIDEVAAEWRTQTSQRFEALTNRERRERDYLDLTPIRYFPVCDPNTV